MPKEFFTDRDIEDMVKRGIQTLSVNDNVVLTDLAFEKARQLGMQIVREKTENPPGAPVRPYLSQAAQARLAPQQTPQKEISPATTPQPASEGAVASPQPGGADLRQRIHQAVIARLGSQVDPALLDVIITRVFQSTGIK